MSLIGDGIDLLKLVDKGRNADLYKQIGEWIDKVIDLQKRNDELLRENANLTEQLRFKGTVVRIAGRTFVEGDDEEICGRCADVDNRPVHLKDLNLDGDGRKATCPQCKVGNGTSGKPYRRYQAEESARRIEKEKQERLAQTGMPQ